MRSPQRFRFSLSTDYNLFAAIIVAAFALLLAISYLTLHYRHQKELHQEVERQALRLQGSFSRAVEYRVYIAEFIANKIGQLPDRNNLENIAGLLGSNFKLDVYLATEKLFPWGIFTWVDRDGYARVSNVEGVLKTPQLVKQEKLLEQSAHSPGKVFFSSSLPQMEALDKENIQGFLGINDADGHYIGTLIVQINLDEVDTATHRQVLTTPAFRYALVNTLDNQVVLSNIPDVPSGSSFSSFSDIKSEPLNPRLLQIGNVELIGLKEIGSLPYKVAFGYDTGQAKAILYERLLPYIFLYGGLAGGYLLLLFFFRKRLISPFIALSDYADAISREHTSKRVPRSNIYEARNLSLNLLQLRRRIKLEKRRQKILDDAVRTARDSSIALEEFLRKANRELSGPTRVIKGFSMLLLKHYYEETNFDLSRDKLVSLVKKIHDAAEQIESGVVNILKVESVNVGLVVHECVTSMQLKSLIVRSITIDTSIEGTLHEFFTDEMRLRQIIIALLNRAITYSKAHDTISLKISMDHNKLILCITDLGMGLSEEELVRIEDKYNSSLNRDSDGTDLALPAIKKIIYLLKGEIIVDAHWGKGTAVTVHLPSLTKEVPSLSVSSLIPEKDQRNIVQFPTIRKE